MSLILPRRSQLRSVEIADEYQDAELLALFNDTEWRDLAGNHSFTSATPPTPVVKSHGRSQRYGDVLGTHLKTTANIPTLPKFTVLSWVRPGTMGSGYKRILETNYSVNFFLGSSNTGNQYNFIVANSSLSACVGGQQVVGQRDFVAGVYNGTHCILYVNGREAARTTASAPYVVKQLCIGANEGNVNSGEHWVGDIDTVAIFPRAFAAGEMLSLYERPDRLVKSPSRRLWSVPSLGGYTLSSDSGSFAITGTDANLEFNRKLTADSGSFAISGTAATFAKGYRLSAESGAFAVTGTAAIFRKGIRLAADPGSFAITGTDATLKSDRIVQADSGSFSITGTAASLEFNRVLQADSGSVAVTGTSASLEFHRVLSADSGSIQITGTDAALIRETPGNYSLTAESGSVSVTGTDASLKINRSMSADSGSFAFTGSAASLRYARLVIAEAGQFAITGTAATLTRTGGPEAITSTVERTAVFQRTKNVNVRFN